MVFADDTSLFFSVNNIRTPFETTNQELNQNNDWFLANKLFLNVAKTKCMIFDKLTDQDNIPLKMLSLQLNGNIIERKKSLKFLGVIHDEHLTWKRYIQLIERKKISKNVGVLHKTSKLINFICIQSISSHSLIVQLYKYCIDWH